MEYAIIHHSTMTDNELYFICNKKDVLINNEKLINNFINYGNYENYEKLKKELEQKQIIFINDEYGTIPNTNILKILKYYNYRF